MNKTIIFYNQVADKMVNLPITWDAAPRIEESEKLAEIALNPGANLEDLEKMITSDTFAMVFNDAEVVPMTYNQWETLRSWQANQMIQEKIAALTLAPEVKAQVSALFENFTEGMRIKYLGQKSWTSLYEDLLQDIEKAL